MWRLCLPAVVLELECGAWEVAARKGGVDGVDGVDDVVGYPHLGPVGAVGAGSEDVGVGELVQYLRCPAGGYAVGVLYVAGGDGRCVDERVQDVLDSGSSPGGDPVPVLLCQFVDASDELAPQHPLKMFRQL